MRSNTVIANEVSATGGSCSSGRSWISCDWVFLVTGYDGGRFEADWNSTLLERGVLDICKDRIQMILHGIP